MDIQKFQDHINEGYACEGDALVLGGAMMNDNDVLSDGKVKVPVKMLNRHGLISGATGTGKTKTIQLIAEEMASNGISVLVMDLKGDLSGLATNGESNSGIESRHEKIGIPYQSEKFNAELLSLSDEPGARLRATVLEFGPILFSKILELNDTQSGIMSVIFKYCDDNGLLLLDLKDFKSVLNYIENDGKDEFTAAYGQISSASTGTILRKIIELEQQGAEKFFGEVSFEPEDLMKIDEKGRGLISVLRLTDMQDRPKLFSTFMLSLLAEIYATFPEAGDLDRPKLCLFIDEAHLIFKNASKALQDQIESIVKLIRSKGVGIFFATQNPSDIPDAVLSQLGFKAQHALRAFTAKDRKEIKQTAENYPTSEYYDIAEMLTTLGIGEAAITVLDEKGRPTPLARTMLRAPKTRMGVLTEDEICTLVDQSKLVEKYNEEIDNESAYEYFMAKFEKAEAEAKEAEANAEANAEEKKDDDDSEGGKPRKLKGEKEEESLVGSLTKNTMVRQMGNTLLREVSRGLLGALGLRSPRRRSSRRMW